MALTFGNRQAKVQFVLAIVRLFSRLPFYVFDLINIIPVISSHISHKVLPIKPVIANTGKPEITVANKSACAKK